MPDIVIEKDDYRIVVDTKWKTPGEGRVGEQDLRQVFTCGLYLDAAKVILLYPRTDDEHPIEAPFEVAQRYPNLQLTCSLAYADLVTEDGTLNHEFAAGFFRSAFRGDAVAPAARSATSP